MKVGFIGMGNMAIAITGGILKEGLVASNDIIASRRNAQALKKIKEQFDIITTEDNMEVVKTADIIFLSIKPQFYSEIIQQIKNEIISEQIIISLAPGKTIEWIENQFGKPTKVIRCMPNTPALVGAGCTGYCLNKLISSQEEAKVQELLSSFGMARMVNETMMDAVVAVSGSSPAYAFIMIEAMADGAVAAGMPRKQAYEFAAQALLGSAKMILETGKHPAELKDMVCSPGGTTIEAVKVLEEKGFRAAIMDAMEACVAKSKLL